jgi:hypothetical protein
VARDGVPVRSWVWSGNTNDTTVIEEVKRNLIGWKLGRVIAVVDRGFCSEENLRLLQRAGGHYIVGEKLRSGEERTEEALARAARFKTVRGGISRTHPYLPQALPNHAGLSPAEGRAASRSNTTGRLTEEKL